MGITGSIVVYVVIWWLIFFMSLPFGVRGQWEGESVEEGTEHGAPKTHGLGRKALVTTGIAAVLWGEIWPAIYFDVLQCSQGMRWD